MRLKKFIGLLLVLGLFIPSSSKAQPPDDSNFQQKQERLQSLIALRIKEEVGLTDEQAVKVSGVLSKYREKRRELRRKMQDYRRDLRQAVDANDSKRTGQIVGDMQKTRGEIEKLEDAQFGEIKGILSPAQQGKFILVMEDIRREVMQFRRPGERRGPTP